MTLLMTLFVVVCMNTNNKLQTILLNLRGFKSNYRIGYFATVPVKCHMIAHNCAQTIIHTFMSRTRVFNAHGFQSHRRISTLKA